jgi:hypothetical protein
MMDFFLRNSLYTLVTPKQLLSGHATYICAVIYISESSRHYNRWNHYRFFVSSFPGFFLDTHTGPPLSVSQQTLFSDIAVCLANGLINIAQAWINVVLGISVKFNPNEKVPYCALFCCMYQLLGM